MSQLLIEVESEVDPEDLKTAPFKELFRYATGYDYFLLTIGVIVSIIAGMTKPFLAKAMGSMTEIFDTNKTPERIFELATHFAKGFLVVGVMFFLLVVLGFYA